MMPFSLLGLGMITAFLCGGGAIVGYPFARYFDCVARHRAILAMPIGLGLIGAVSLPIFLWVLPLTPFTILSVGLCIAGLSWLASWYVKIPVPRDATQRLSVSWIIVALVMSIIPAYAVAPHFFSGGVGFGAPVFDHIKVALIDEITRSGMPPHNPFFSRDGVSPLLNYYYGWYFLAAQAALLSGTNGWCADIVFTGLTAFFSLFLMGWGALRFSGRMSAAWLVFPLCMISNLIPVLRFIFGPGAGRIVFPEHGLETWIVQSAWVPQHLFGAVIACLAILGFVKLLERRSWDVFISVMVGALVTFSYSCSIWVGVVSLIPILGLITCLMLRRKYLWSIMSRVGVTGAIAFVAAMPLAIQQIHRLGSGPVIAFWVFPVVTRHGIFLGDVANFLTFWTYLLILYFGAIYVPSVIWFCQRLQKREAWSLSEKALFLSCLVPLLMAAFFHSVIANNDLGWRCILISVLAMTIVSARVLTEKAQHLWVIITTLVLLIPGAISGLAFAVGITTTQAFYGRPSSDTERFERIDPAMWRAVRDVTPRRGAVANNPFYEASLTLWEGNISWAMLSNRDSCTPPSAYLEAFAVGVSKDEQRSFYELTKRVFNETARDEDFAALRDRYQCRTLLVVPSDKLWEAPLSRPEPFFKLVAQSEGQWRIYRAQPERDGK